MGPVTLDVLNIAEWSNSVCVTDLLASLSIS